LETIPLYVRAGSILPLGPIRQYAAEKADQPLTIQVYAGEDGEFDLYDDSGDGYGYEKGICAWMHFQWNDAERKLNHSSEGDAAFLPSKWNVVIIG
jgi:alpha-D-xyloside xylohydrolase